MAKLKHPPPYPPTKPVIRLDLYGPWYAFPSWDLHVECTTVLGDNLYTPLQMQWWLGTSYMWAVRRAEARTVVVEQNKQLIGFIDVDDTGFIDKIYVKPEMTRKRIGTLLLGWATRETIYCHCREIATVASPLARPFFEANGFTIEKTMRRNINGARITSYLMVKSLAAKNVEVYERLPAMVPEFELEVAVRPKQRAKFMDRRWRGYHR